jgi:hypothetical protein
VNNELGEITHFSQAISLALVDTEVLATGDGLKSDDGSLSEEARLAVVSDDFDDELAMLTGAGLAWSLVVTVGDNSNMLAGIGNRGQGHDVALVVGDGEESKGTLATGSIELAIVNAEELLLLSESSQANLSLGLAVDDPSSPLATSALANNRAAGGLSKILSRRN